MYTGYHIQFISVSDVNEIIIADHWLILSLYTLTGCLTNGNRNE